MTTTADELREEVRRRYAESARTVSEGTGKASCGRESCCVMAEGDAAKILARRCTTPSSGMSCRRPRRLPRWAAATPTAVAELREGETVLDLGSGGGIDVILSAMRVGPSGTAYGLDMTDEMLALAQRNAAEAR
jgi:arsenite methyltransferase